MPTKNQTKIRKRANAKSPFAKAMNAARKAVNKAKRTPVGSAAMEAKYVGKSFFTGMAGKNNIYKPAIQANTRAHAARRPTVGVKPKSTFKAKK